MGGSGRTAVLHQPPEQVHVAVLCLHGTGVFARGALLDEGIRVLLLPPVLLVLLR